MREFKVIKFATVLICIVILTLVGCGGNIYHDVFNDENSINVKAFAVPAERCYQSAKRAVLSQNFRIEKDDVQTNSFVAARYFDDGKDTIVLTLSVNVMNTGNDKATVYASAVQHMDKVRVKTDRTLLGLLPVGSEATKVKQNEKTIEDKEFYERFFAAIDKEIKK